MASPFADPRHAHALFEILREIKELRGEVATLTTKVNAIDIAQVSADLDIVRKGTLRVLKAQLNLAGLLEPTTTVTPEQIKDYYNSIRPR